ncbi:Bifunctional epoxide hydrolase 2 [Dichanthelium oligosanthes]|uniref:soluble epoxide hydrolase n=1 Tax=Dichanthelium oligosanthes TaxID=888268 RepID=A0A1E5W7J5_9POAL|nr:Bifunctional epoxide hydrolase 2 [Dichanthelium oligosanthes]
MTMAPGAGAADEDQTVAITHRTVELGTGGVRLHVAEAGPAAGPTVLLLHGFPELWYTWRHQMRALAAAGYRAVAPDLRGYGGSDAPAAGDPGQYTALHVVGDLVALIDALGEKTVFVAAHDWGALTAWSLCLFRPDKVRALVALSVAYTPRSAARKPVEGLRALFGDDFYICRIQEPGAVEAEFARLGTELVLRKFLCCRSPGPLFIPKSGWGSPDDEVPLPSWLTEEDLKYYTSEFEKTGFTGGLNYYRALNKTWELTSPWTAAEINVPVKFIIGDLDLTYHNPGIQDFIHKGGFKKFVPLLDDVVVMKDVGHFINEEKPKEVSEHIISFIKKFN